MVGAPDRFDRCTIGTPVFSDEIDICNARIRASPMVCVANATSSRVGLKTERKLRVVFEDDAYLSRWTCNKRF